MICVWFSCSLTTHAQPGPSGGWLSIKVYDKGRLVNLRDDSWKVIPMNINLSEGDDYMSPQEPGFYYIIPKRTPAGGDVGDNFYLDIVHKGDSMRIHPPDFRHMSIELDSIPFAKGEYTIPASVYQFKAISKRASDYNGQLPVPNIYSDWQLFRKETYKCYLEKVIDLDNVPEDNSFYGEPECYTYRNWPYLSVDNGSVSYYFNRNVIVQYKYSTHAVKVFVVKDISADHFMGRGGGVPRITGLYRKDGAILAMVYKNNDNCGIFRLNFVEEQGTPRASGLVLKQLLEEYQSAIKSLKVYEQAYRERETSVLTAAYKERLRVLMQQSRK
ncbi:hypothetical protein D3C71_194440 [compost metagenome]